MYGYGWLCRNFFIYDASYFGMHDGVVPAHSHNNTSVTTGKHQWA